MFGAVCVIANNVAPAGTDSAGADIESKDTLKALFGYNQFKVIGQVATRRWRPARRIGMAASKYFALAGRFRRRDATPVTCLNLKLFQEKKLLLETEAKLSKRSPLVIAVRRWATGNCSAVACSACSNEVGHPDLTVLDLRAMTCAS